MTRGERKISVSEGEQSSLKRKGGDQVKHKACEHSNQQPNYMQYKCNLHGFWTTINQIHDSHKQELLEEDQENTILG